MELGQERPPAYAHSDPDTLHLPSVPTQDPQSTPVSNGVHLPDLKSLGLPASTHSRNISNTSDNYRANLFSPSSAESQQWQNTSLHGLSFPRVPTAAPRAAADLEIGSPMDTESMVSIDDHQNNATQPGALNSKELLAAEAIVGLGNPDYAMSPSGRSNTLPPQANGFSHEAENRQEPLLSLLTSSHPWIGGTINGSLNAYSSTKAYSPRFVQYSADFLERNVANTVGSVGRRTGVERSLRRYLGDRQPNGEQDFHGHKRRRTDTDMMDIEKGLQTPPVRAARTRGDSDISFARSEDSLPPYDSNRSPAYEERATNGEGQLLMAQGHEKSQSESHRQPHWSTRMMITTSGLGAALSETSLRSLKFCLGMMSNASNHLAKVMRALKMVLEDYDKTTNSSTAPEQTRDEKGVGSRQLMRDFEERQREEQSRRLADKIKTLCEDIWKTVKSVVEMVSTYAGGALPENASNFVRDQLLSVPGRWRATAYAEDGHANNGAGAEVRRANRMLAYAKEGLDMMEQVSMVVSSTIQSAEQWLDTFGKKRKEEDGSAPHDEKAANGVALPPMMPPQN
ncbi:transcription factor Opi1-domain-containing protein [Phyllosticta citricarpa]|uniref:Transcription factor Opi1-domain-containing protein n=2 Tax=Phyllosticta TaxID=121621 RepID=A0ABR1MP29_9PEZI